MAYSPSVRINPPLVIDEELVDRGVDILAQVFDRFEEDYFGGRNGGRGA